MIFYPLIQAFYWWLNVHETLEIINYPTDSSRFVVNNVSQQDWGRGSDDRLIEGDINVAIEVVKLVY